MVLKLESDCMLPIRISFYPYRKHAAVPKFTAWETCELPKCTYTAMFCCSVSLEVLNAYADGLVKPGLCEAGLVKVKKILKQKHSQLGIGMVYCCEEQK